ADPATGVSVYDSYQQGGWNVYGGTSAAAPIIAGVYAAAGTPVKDTYPASYPYANPGHLNDVIAGGNGTCAPAYLCTAGAGYDGPTGLGTPNGVDAFTTGPHGVVTGTVTDASTKAPVAGATVSVGDSTALSDASGHYRTSVPAGTHDATASAYGYADKTVKGVTVTDGGSVTEDFALGTVPSSTVSGKVTDGSGHSWPLYATISVDGVPGGPVHTDPYTGRYSLKLPQGHKYTLDVNANYPGYEAVTKKVTLGTSDTTADLKIPVDSYDCVAAGYTIHNTGTTQTFDGTSAPAGWTLDNTDAGGWAFDDPQLPWWSYSTGNHTGGNGGFAVTDTRTMNSLHPADMSIVSPVTDFSGAAHPDLTFSTDLSAQNGPVADVEVTTDGGTTWNPAWSRGNDLRGPAHVDVPLPMAAHLSAVQVRFHFSSRLLNAWWQVDDVHLGDRSCDPVRGGLVAGTVTDANTGRPVVGATVTSAAAKPAEHAMTAATPDDPNLPDAFYWMFSSLTGTHDFTAARRHYVTGAAHVGVAAAAVTRTPFALKAGRITVAPGKIGLSVPWQGKATRTVTVKNTGSAPARVTLGEHDGSVKALAAHGAPTTRIKGTYSPLPLLGKGAAHRAARGAAPHGAVPAEAPWTPMADYLPGPVVDNAVVSLGGRIYSAFGTSTADFYHGMYAYDPTAGTWSRVAGPADGRQKPAMAVLKGKIYATGGWGSTGAPDGKTEVYDPTADTWTTAAANPRPLAGSGVAVLGDRMYVVGGCATDCGATDVMAYDPATNAWTRHAGYPEPVSWEACGALYGELYCAGGTGPDGETRHAYVYDPATDSWSRAADLPIDLYASGYTTAQGRLLVSGGVTQNNTMITNQGFSYDPAGDTWTPMANSNNAVYRGGSACGFYKIGGMSKDQYGTLTPVAGAEVLPGVSDCGDGNDVRWLAAKPKTVTVAPGASARVTVSVDASAADVTQPGTYTAKFAIGTDTPYATPVLPVSMTVAPPKTWGKITGTVTGPSGPLPGAVVQITTSRAHHTLTTDASGRYQLWTDARNPLQVICADDGYQSRMTTARIRKGATTTLDFALRKV
ncbi:carboxypeptidase regulatory-like domain-containing protein, partial [Streptomyces sp. NPDC005122]